MIWKRPEHREVTERLAALDAELLAECHFCFGGGTRIVCLARLDVSDSAVVEKGLELLREDLARAR